MDTLVTSHPDIDLGLNSRAAGTSARLPGEPGAARAATGGLEAGERLPSSAAKPRPKRRGTLLAGVGLVAVAVAGGAFLVSPYNTVYPLPRLQATVGDAADRAERYAQATLRPILAPAAALANVAVPPTPLATRDPYTPTPRDQEVAELLSLHPDRATDHGHVVTAVAPGDAGLPVKAVTDRSIAPAPTVAAGPDATGGPAGDVPREPGSPAGRQAPVAPPSPPAIPAATAVPPATAAPRGATALVIASLPQAQPAVQGSRSAPRTLPAPVLVALPQASDARPVDATTPAGPPLSGAVSEAASLRFAPRTLPAPTAVAPPRATDARPADSTALAGPPSPRDAISEAATLRAGPMTSREQVQVLNLMTEVATTVKDLRKQQAQMRTDLGKSSADVASRLTDFERRLAFTEARGAVMAADDATAGAPASAPVAPAGNPDPSPARAIPVAITGPIAVVPAAGGIPKAYRVQAASPGLALLAQVDRGGGDGAQMQVVVGDTVPEYGRVKSITQKGTTWIVTTDRGAIQ